MFKMVPILFLILLTGKTYSLVPYTAEHRKCDHRIALDDFVLDPFLFSGSRYEIDVYLTMDRMQDELTLLVEKLIANGDRRLRRNKKVCLGIFAGKNSNRAYANGHYAIGFGANLLKNLKTNYRYESEVFRVILYHEFAHAVQFRYGHNVRKQAPIHQHKLVEMQADCMSAVFMKIQGQYNRTAIEGFREFSRRFGAKNQLGGYGTSSQRFAASEHGAHMFEREAAYNRKINSHGILTKICSKEDMNRLLR